MEDIIIWIVIVAIGVAVEYLKKKRGSDSTSASKASVSSRTDRQHHRQAIQSDATLAAPFKPEPYTAETTRSDSWGEPIFSTSPSPPGPAKPADKATAAKSAHKDKANRIHHYSPLTADIDTDSADEGNDIQSAGPTEGARQYDMAEQALLKAHYDRWRQAILDTQVLERKF